MQRTEFNLSLSGIQNVAEAGLKVPYCAIFTTFPNNNVPLEVDDPTGPQRVRLLPLWPAPFHRGRVLKRASSGRLTFVMSQRVQV